MIIECTGLSKTFKTNTLFEEASFSIESGETVGIDADFLPNMGLLVDSPGYLPLSTGYENLSLLADIRKKIAPEAIRQIMVDLRLDPDDKTKVKDYSMGMKQKLGIAQAIMEDQEIILLDEPFNALDFDSYGVVLKTLEALNRQGKTLLLTSHNHWDLKRICSRLLCINDKKIVPFTDELMAFYFGEGELRGVKDGK